MKQFITAFSLIVLFILSSLSTQAQPSQSDIDFQVRDIGQSLRCVVCQNQSLNESDAPLAKDMRKLIRVQLEDGKSKTEIMDYMRDNYGDYVLLKPPVQSNTVILWFGPLLLLCSLLLWFIRTARNSQKAVHEERDKSS